MDIYVLLDRGGDWILDFKSENGHFAGNEEEWDMPGRYILARGLSKQWGMGVWGSVI